MLKPTVVSFIGVLLFASRPFAIAWLVIAVVILPFEAHAFGYFPHVSKEVVEYQPALAYLDSAPTVVRKGGMAAIRAPHAHLTPCAVCAGLAHAVGLIPSFELGLPAAATCRLPGSEICGADGANVAAIAAAFPSDLGVTSVENICGPVEYEKSAESLACAINEIGHKP